MKSVQTLLDGMTHQTVTCPEHGPYMAFRMQNDDGTYTRWSICPRCQAIRPGKEMVTYDYAAEDRKRRARLLEEAMIPEVYAEYGFDNFVIENETHLAAMQACHDLVDGHIDKLLLYGPTGVGKTKLAVGTIKEAISKDMGARYVSEQDLLTEIMLGGKTEFGGDKLALRAFASVQLLVIDEIGKHKLSTYDADLLFAVIEARHSRKKPTMFVGNISGKAQYEAHFTDPMRSRISERGKSYRIVGDDKRLAQAVV